MVETMYIVPEEILENLTCNVCEKFLTMMPVISCDDGGQKCGRCWSSDDTGFFLPNPIIERGYFKCVNRFDGCRELLSCGRVYNHEALCDGKSHMCPLCPKFMSIPSYHMIKHFETYHNESYLRGNSFAAEVALGIVDYYLYRSRDHLFFIKYETRDTGEFWVSAYYLGDDYHAELIAQTFTVNLNHIIKYHSFTKPVSTVSSIDETGAFYFQMPVGLPEVFIEFHLDVAGLEVLLVGDRTVNQNVGLLRTLRLRDSRNARIDVTEDFSSVQLEDQEFFMYCVCCSLPETDRVAFVEVRPKVYQLVCRSCKLYYKRKSPDMHLIPEWDVHPVIIPDTRNHLEYSCVWRSSGCLEFHIGENINEHEQGCQFHPLEQCPVKSCYYVGTLTQLEEHLFRVHPTEVIYKGPVLGLPLGTRNLSGKDYFIWTHYGFVTMTDTGDDLEFKLSFLWQKENEACNDFRMKVLVHDDNYQVFHLVTDSSPVCVPRGIFITVKCFFEFENIKELLGGPIPD